MKEKHFKLVCAHEADALLAPPWDPSSDNPALTYPQTPLSTHSQWVAKATLIPEVSVGTCGFHLQPKQVNVHMFDAADVRIFAFR